MILIFDFDGVIVDSLLVNVRILNERFSWFLKKLLTSEMIRERGLKEILKEYRVTGWKLVFLVWYVRRAIRNEELPIQQGISELIQSLHKNHRLLLVSSNSVYTIQKTLSQSGILGCFQKMYTGFHIFKKASLLRKIKDQTVKNAYYVGDETRDVEAAREANIKSIAVTWGWESEGVLQKTKPDYLVKSPDGLKELIRSLN